MGFSRDKATHHFVLLKDGGAISAPPAPTEQHAKTDARENCSSQSLAVGNRNETGLLITYFYDSHGNSPYSSTPAPTFAACAGIAHTARTRPRSVAVHDFCHRNDRFAVGCDGFAVDGFHVRLA
jgi:hypothetical protein